METTEVTKDDFEYRFVLLSGKEVVFEKDIWFVELEDSEIFIIENKEDLKFNEKVLEENGIELTEKTFNQLKSLVSEMKSLKED